MVVRMRHTRSHTGNRRSHHALSSLRMSKCADCGQMKVPHRVCGSCGKYNGRVVIDMVKAAEKRAAKDKKKGSARADSHKEQA